MRIKIRIRQILRIHWIRRICQIRRVRRIRQIRQVQNNLISPNQLGFKQDDSCINQLLYITHEMYKSFDEVLRFEVYF